MKAIISGGGSGGHIFPAIAIAGAIKDRWPDADILFIGAQGRMEMERVPAAGYPIQALPIEGLKRPLYNPRNIAVAFKMLRSQLMVRRILRSFNPDIVVGVGGYASAPTLKTAAQMGFRTLLQEQNSYPGLTNKMLAPHADTICVAYDGLQQYFPASKIVLTGNPVRKDIEQLNATPEEALGHFDLNPAHPVVLSVGGSLGAGTINRMIQANLQYFPSNQIQIIWQTGRWDYPAAQEAVRQAGVEQWVKVHQFISRMDLAYIAADAVISRAGAIAISELSIVGKPLLLIPSPNVAEDHQTKNAQALASKGAAILIPDAQCAADTLPALTSLLADQPRRQAMSQALKTLAMPGAAARIVDQIATLTKQ
ncbi:MAG: undecaprenyldiphospho-muramoylpentapeptide beta-N-acetylglucosaminyltransferase [Bacteroidales bacterium]|nr:undecaprenyldiphospho-muramoylpentapeptide beta-N-acetylglucosaminyltransferase [Bacteroidales bacterium]